MFDSDKDSLVMPWGTDEAVEAVDSLRGTGGGADQAVDVADSLLSGA